MTDLAKAGALLYGERWQAPLARDLRVSRRTLVNWLAGAHPVPEDAGKRLRELLTARRAAIGDALRR